MVCIEKIPFLFKRFGKDKSKSIHLSYRNNEFEFSFLTPQSIFTGESMIKNIKFVNIKRVRILCS